MLNQLESSSVRLRSGRMLNQSESSSVWLRSGRRDIDNIRRERFGISGRVSFIFEDVSCQGCDEIWKLGHFEVLDMWVNLKSLLSTWNLFRNYELSLDMHEN